jgi:hypothetical protein
LLGKQTNDASKYKEAFKSKQMQASKQHTSNFGRKKRKLSPNVIMKSNGLKGEKV